MYTREKPVTTSAVTESSIRSQWTARETSQRSSDEEDYPWTEKRLQSPSHILGYYITGIKSLLDNALHDLCAMPMVSASEGRSVPYM